MAKAPDIPHQIPLKTTSCRSCLSPIQFPCYGSWLSTGARFSKVPKLFGRISGYLILFVSSKRRRLEAQNSAFILIFIPFTTYEKTGFPELAGRSFQMAFRARKVKSFPNFRETGHWYVTRQLGFINFCFKFFFFIPLFALKNCRKNNMPIELMTERQNDLTMVSISFQLLKGQHPSVQLHFVGSPTFLIERL